MPETRSAKNRLNFIQLHFLKRSTLAQSSHCQTEGVMSVIGNEERLCNATLHEKLTFINRIRLQECEVDARCGEVFIGWRSYGA